MTYRIHITPRALIGLTEIFEYIQKHSPQNARSVVTKLLDAIDDLEFMPDRFKIVGHSRVRRSPIHARVVRPFVVYYRVDESQLQVYIVEIRHGSRDLPRTFE